MITDSVVSWFMGTLGGILGTVPHLPDPIIEAFGSTLGQLTAIGVHVSNFGPLVPFAALGYALVITAAFWAVTITIQVTRIVASFVTLGGGSV